MARDPFPLQWPDGWPRTPASGRRRSAFQISGFARVRDEMLHQIRLLGASRVVITSDLPVRLDGLPIASARCDDPGISVWWVKGGVEQVMACDQWHSHGENLRAIAKTIEALRGIDRWGSSQLVKRAFAGFAALPPGPSDAPRKRAWREVLSEDVEQGVDAWPTAMPADELLAIAKLRRNRLLKKHHPDVGGDHEIAAAINTALAEAERELGAAP